MNSVPLYPLKFEPIYQHKVWGGRRLADLLSAPLPDNDPIGEAWLLSDRKERSSVVKEGALKGKTITELMDQYPEQLLGKAASQFKRFPLSLKFVDAQTIPSLQVHPPDQHKDDIRDGETGKTEAWVILNTGINKRIYAGLKPKTTPEKVITSLHNHRIEDFLNSFKPSAGDAVFLKAGTVHTIEDAVVFEIQENSDATFHLYDWDHIDKKTGKQRDLQIDRAIACIDFSQGAIKPVKPVIEIASPVMRELLFDCDHFILWRMKGNNPFIVEGNGMPTILVCIEGKGKLEYKGSLYDLHKGDATLLPAALNICSFRPQGNVTMLEITLPGKDNLLPNQKQQKKKIHEKSIVSQNSLH